MDITSREPIEHQWPPNGSQYPARQLSIRLGSLPSTEIPDDIVPLLAAAAAQLAQNADLDWRVGNDDLNTALIRMIARGALRLPDGDGEHVQRAIDALGPM